MVRVHLDQAELQNYGKEDDVMLLNKNILEIPIPPESQFTMEKAVQEFTNEEIDVELAKARQKIATERKRQAIKVGFQFAAGKFDEVNWREVNGAFVEHTLLAEPVQRAGDREAAPHVDGLRQPPVRDPGGPGGDPVREARLPLAPSSPASCRSSRSIIR